MQPKGMEYFIKNRPGEADELKTVDNIITQSGDLIKYTGIDVIIKRLLRALTIAQNTYIMDPELGSGIYKYIYEPVTEFTKNSITHEISYLIMNHLPGINISFKVLFFRNRKGFRIDFTIDYGEQKKNVTVNIDESLLKTLS